MGAAAGSPSLLVTGANGQLGRCLRDMAAGREARFTDLPRLDVTDPRAVAGFLDEAAPAVVVNCAAYTDVDAAETHPDQARRLNAEAPGLLARACARRGIRLIHVSTDYVFDGRKRTPYTETDPTGPQTVYGSTKLAGERAVAAAGGRWAVVRTAWLYSEYGRNFVRTMLRLAGERSEVRVVNDQVGSPTYAADLAGFILHLADNAPDFTGIVNYCGGGSCSWYGFACAVLAGRPVCVEPCSTEDYPSPARRPAYSVLDTGLASSGLGGRVIRWEEGLRRCLARIEEIESLRKP